MMIKTFNISPVGVVHSCFTEKFGTPRQPGLVKSAGARLELFQPCNRDEMVKGLESFSHIWLQFLFHETVDEGWKPTVRPPRLGGQKRVGVFASRSPHRPNFIGMSAVKLEGITREKGKLFLELLEVDLLDQTPILDIKPYIPYSDQIEKATCGYTRMEFPKIQIIFGEEPLDFCKEYQIKTGRDLKSLIEDTLLQDPRPASQRDTKREFGILLWNVNVRWLAEEESFTVLRCEI